MRRKLKLTPSDYNDIKMLYDQGQDSKRIAMEYNISPQTVIRTVIRKGGKIRNKSECQRKYEIKESYFDTIDSEDKSYFLGLLFSDGSNNVKKGAVALVLQEDDKHILDSFTEFLQPNKPLYFDRVKDRNPNHKNNYRLTISNRHISDVLNRHGCIQNKSQGLFFPESVPNILTHHFIRGYFDGDGSIYTSFQKGKYKSSTVSFSGCLQFLLKLQNILIDNTGVSMVKLCKYKRSKVNYSLVYGGRINVVKIYNYMYKDSTLFLQRKYDKFNQAILPSPPKTE